MRGENKSDVVAASWADIKKETAHNCYRCAGFNVLSDDSEKCFDIAWSELSAFPDAIDGLVVNEFVSMDEGAATTGEL